MTNTFSTWERLATGAADLFNALIRAYTPQAQQLQSEGYSTAEVVVQSYVTLRVMLAQFEHLARLAVPPESWPVIETIIRSMQEQQAEKQRAAGEETPKVQA